MLIARRLLVAASLLFMCNCIFAQHKLSGKIADSTGKPVPFASVILDKTRYSAVAGPDGAFTMDALPAGTYELKAFALGHSMLKQSIVLDGDLSLDLRLRASATELEEVPVLAGRVNEGSGMAFSNLDKEQLTKRNFGQDVPYVLNEVPNVVASSDAGNFVGYTGIRIRGTDATRINVTINGVPVNDAESQGTFWVNMPDLLTSVNSIQVQRGVGTSVNGAGAFGASVNLETSRLNEKPFATLLSTAGSFNTFRNSFAAGTGLLKNGFVFDARASRITSDGYIDRATSNLHSYYLSGAWYGNKSVVRLINFFGTEKTYQAWNLVSEENLRLGRRTFNELGLYEDELELQRTYDNQVDNYTQNNFQLHIIHQFNSRLSFNATGHYTRGFGYYEEYREDNDAAFYGLNIPPSLMLGSEQVSSTDLIRQRWLDNHFGGAVFNLNLRATSSLNFTLGGGYNSYFGKHFGKVIWARYAGISEKGHQYYFNTANKNDGNLYLKTSWKAHSRLDIFADAQVRSVAYEFLGPDNADTLREQLRSYIFFNPKVGASFRLTSAFDLYASAAVANKEPNRNDFIENKPGNQPQHETLLDIEAGLRFRKGNWCAVLNHYNMNYRNQLVLNGEINDVGASKRINVPVSYRRGLELELGWDINRYFSFSGNASWSVNKIVGFTEYADYYTGAFDYLGNQRLNYMQTTDISFSPSMVSAAQLAIKPFNGFEIALVHKYVGKQYLDNTSTNDRSIDPYSVMDMRMHYTFGKKQPVTLMLSVYNLLNEEYETNGYTYNFFVDGERQVYNYYAPAAPLNVMGGIRISL